METFWQDLRYSLRMLLKRPGFTAAVVITLALGIGANATIFTWIKVIFLESLSGVDEPDDLVEIWGATRNNSALSLSYPDFLDLRDRNEVLSGVVAHQVLPLNLGRGGKPERVRGAIVSGNYFEVLGVKALVGRTFLPEEDRTPNAHPVVVIGYGLWQRRFGAEPGIIGRQVTLNAHELTVIGIAPKEFGSTYTGAVLDVWTPVMMKDYVARPHFSLTDRGSRWLMVMGRLRPGVTAERAQANFASIAGQLERAYPQTNEQMGLAVFSLTLLALTLSAVGLYGVMAYTVSRRTRELGIRIAIGATRHDILRVVLGHALLLSAIGIAGGVIVALMVSQFLVHLLYGVGPADPLTFAVIPVVLLGVALAASYLPARRALKIDPVVALRTE